MAVECTFTQWKAAHDTLVRGLLQIVIINDIQKTCFKPNDDLNV